MAWHAQLQLDYRLERQRTVARHLHQGFARFDRKTDAIDCGELAAFSHEAGAQVGDFKQRHAQARARQAAWNWSIWASMRLRSSSPAGRSRVARQAIKGWKRSRLLSCRRCNSPKGSA